VIQEPFWTSAARHADIRLPVAPSLERNDISAGWMDRTVYAMRKAIEPVGESRSDYEITTSLSERLGHKGAFTEGRGEMDWIRSLYDTLRKQIATGHNTIPDFDSFWELGQIDLPSAAKPFVMFEEFRNDPVANPLKTPSGKIEIFSKTIAGFGYDDCPGHPVWMPPSEWLGAPLTKRFPLHMISNQPGPRLHSQTDPAPHSLENKVNGREPILLHPSDAAARGITNGDVVRVFNDRGACLAGARITDVILPGVVQLATGAWYDPLEAGKIGTLDVHGNPNVLTLDKGSSKLAQAPIAHSALVEVERFDGDVPPIRVHSAPPVVDKLSDWNEN
jgi:biotin/methionine sulfoxide reductase